MFKKIAWLILPFLSFAGVALAQVNSGLTSELSLGSKGSQVTTLQSFLSGDQKIYPAGILSGYFGPLTANAVSQFQLYAGLPMVGRVGPLTLARINSILNSVGVLDTNAPVNTNLNISVGRSEAAINWQTNELSQGKVFYDTKPIISLETSQPATQPFISGSVSGESTIGFNHSLSLTGLNPDTTYYLVIESVDRSGNVSLVINKTFTTVH